MSSEKRPRVANRRSAAIAGTAVIALGAVAAGCGGGTTTKAGATVGKVATFIPAGSPMYAEVSTDLSGPQWTQLTALAKKFPAYPELIKKLDDDPKMKLGWTVIKPLLGTRAAIGVTSIPSGAAAQAGSGASDLAKGSLPSVSTGDAPVVLAAEIASGKGKDVQALIMAEGQAKVLGTHNGVEYFGDEKTQGAIVDDVLVIANTHDGLFKSLDAHAAGGDRTIAGTQRVKDALAKLPADVFVQAYVDYNAILKAGASSNPAGAAALNALNISPDASLAVSLSAETDGVRMKGIGSGLGATSNAGAQDFTPKLIANAPADSIAYFGFSNLAAQAKFTLDTVLKSNPDAQRQLAGALPQLPALLGVSVDDLKALTTKEHAVIVSKGKGVPNVALVLEQADGARASKTIETLRAKLPTLAGAIPQTAGKVAAFEKVDLGGGLTGWQTQVPNSNGFPGTLAPTEAVDGSNVIIGLNPDSVKAVRKPVASLASNADYAAAAKQVPDAVSSLMWLNVPEAVKAVQALQTPGGKDPFEGAQGKKLKANLAPVKSVVGWATAGAEPTTEAFVTIK